MLDLQKVEALQMVMAELLNSATLGAFGMMIKVNRFLFVTVAITNSEEFK